MTEFERLVLNRRPKRLTKLLHSLELKTIGSREIKVRIPEFDISYIVPTHAHIGKLLRQNGMYEEHIVNWITERFAPDSGGVFVDVGANFGWYSCLFSRIAGNRGKVFLFEPEPDNADLLGRNLALNGCTNYRIIRAAAGSHEDTGTLHKAHHSNPGAHTLVDGLYSEGNVEVPIVTLDGTVDTDVKISLLKIDIEGFELEALRGAKNVLERTETMILEFTPPFLRRGGYNPSELWQLVRDQGFAIFRFEHESAPVPLASEPTETCDLLLTKRHR